LKRFRALSALSISLFVFSLLVSPSQALAQDETPNGAVYIVQDGDTLWSIAVRFGVTLDALAAANGITDLGQLAAGDQLVIPGLEGVQGILTTRRVSYGDTLSSLSRRYQMPVDLLVRLNHLSSPAELYAGSNLTILQENSAASGTRRADLQPGQSLFELAVSQNQNPWAYRLANSLPGAWSAIPGDVLHLPDAQIATAGAEPPGALPESIESIQIAPQPFVQGKAAMVRVKGDPALALDGSLNGRKLQFFPDTDGSFVTLQGIHAMTEPGLYTLVLTSTLPGDPTFPPAPFTFSQPVYINSGDYPFDPVLVVDPETIDPAVTAPEDAQWASLAATPTAQRWWKGLFTSPAPQIYSDCWPSLYGNRRSYNGSAYSYFHTGLDYCGSVGTEIYAPAPGVVVFAGPLTVRGNATMIDHGWGVYTGYLHQSEILVKAGDRVEAGQLIGLVGGTGRVTGAHLHFEVWAGGVQIDPMDWLKEAFLDW
jgi:murein DD-endopeptidase MepM/ murein hydrolase activator NlpD